MTPSSVHCPSSQSPPTPPLPGTNLEPDTTSQGPRPRQRPSDGRGTGTGEVRESPPLGRSAGEPPAGLLPTRLPQPFRPASRPRPRRLARTVAPSGVAPATKPSCCSAPAAMPPAELAGHCLSSWLLGQPVAARRAAVLTPVPLVPGQASAPRVLSKRGGPDSPPRTRPLGGDVLRPVRSPPHWLGSGTPHTKRLTHPQ